MQSKLQPVSVIAASSSGSTVKTSALYLFRGIRALGNVLAEVPDVAVKAGREIAQAWEESSRSPKR